VRVRLLNPWARKGQILKILIVEDDIPQLDFLKKHLAAEFPGVTIETIETEATKLQMPQLLADLPNVVILDMLLGSAEVMEEELREQEGKDLYGSGKRCRDLLASFPETRMIPIILYSWLDSSNAYSCSQLQEEGLFHLAGGELMEVTAQVSIILKAQHMEPL
jgi:hypothetical protein